MVDNNRTETQANLSISELKRDDLPFLLKLWHSPEVMRYADEFPGLRGWTKADQPEVAWEKYEMRRASLGIDYTQLILWLENNTPIGESFFAPLSEGNSFGKWQKPDQVKCLLGDIKLEPAYWGQGLGTAGIRQVVQFAFRETSCGLFVVPPHIENLAAYRVYEKAGFLLFTGMKSWRNHRVMEMTRERFEEVYKDVPHS
jgi:RimJ/RimL family protein N-acetyltransferase